MEKDCRLLANSTLSNRYIHTKALFNTFPDGPGLVSCLFYSDEWLDQICGWITPLSVHWLASSFCHRL